MEGLVSVGAKTKANMDYSNPIQPNYTRNTTTFSQDVSENVENDYEIGIADVTTMYEYSTASRTNAIDTHRQYQQGIVLPVQHDPDSSLSGYDEDSTIADDEESTIEQQQHQSHHHHHQQQQQYWGRKRLSRKNRSMPLTSILQPPRGIPLVRVRSGEHSDMSIQGQYSTVDEYQHPINNRQKLIHSSSYSANPQSPPAREESGGSGGGSVPKHAIPFIRGQSRHSDIHHRTTSSGSSISSSTNLSAMQRNHNASISILLIGFIFVGFMAVGIAEMSASNATIQVSQLEHNKININSRIQQYGQDIRTLEREIEAMDLMIQQKEQDNAAVTNQQRKLQNNNNDNGNYYQNAIKELHTLQGRLRLEAQQAIDLKREVQDMSKTELKRKYGTEPIRLEIELVFPSVTDGTTSSHTSGSHRRRYHKNRIKIHDDEDTGPTKFIIELAPIDMMPHSIHTFLQMVTYKLLDGCSFILNALHVVKAAPLPYDGSSAAEKAKAFAKHGLESVAFKEYNESYPHKQYTIGFAADGSPSFYINTEDNSEIHVGDPCFGKVVDGIDTIHRLESSPTRNGIWFEKRIGIKSAKVIS